MRAEADIGIGGEMKHHVAARNRRSQRAGVEQVGLDKLEAGRLQCPFEEAALAGGKIVVADNTVASSKEPIDQAATDEAGSAGYECVHSTFSRRPRLASQ